MYFFLCKTYANNLIQQLLLHDTERLLLDLVQRVHSPMLDCQSGYILQNATTHMPHLISQRGLH